MLVSIIIPVRDDATRLRLCVGGLLSQTSTAVCEILIVDNTSYPPVLNEWYNDRRVRVLRHNTGGSYAARNAALLVARGDVVVFTDSDCLPMQNWIERGLAALEDSKADVVAGRVEVFPEHAQAPTAVELYEMMFAFPQEAYVAHDGFGVTANLFVRRKIFGAVGRFDDGLYSGGDREWGRRVTAAGFRLVYEPTCVVQHPARKTVAELSKKLDRVVRGLTGSELRGAEGVKEARGRCRKAAYPPIGLLVRVCRSCPHTGIRTRLAVCIVVLRIRLMTALAYHKAAKSLRAAARNA